MTMEDEKRVFESLKKLADTYRMETAQLTDMTLKFCMSKNCLGTPAEAAKFIADRYVEEWAEFDAENGDPLEGSLTLGENLNHICGMYAEHLAEQGPPGGANENRSIP
jgi:hypothetical protein